MTQATVPLTTTTTVGKTKANKAAEKSGNLILDIAAEVESLTKVKALHLADNLVDGTNENDFRLGGVLKLIAENSWFEGYPDFDTFVFEKYGFQGRKARYLMAIYTDLVTKQIPWDKVSSIGWTKLKELAPILTLENVDDWVAKATALSVLELIAAIKAKQPAGEAASSGTNDDVQTIKFKLKSGQLEVVQAALAKAKGETGTEYDNVALENICAGYVGGTITGVQTDLPSVLKGAGWEKVLTVFGEIFPEVDIVVTPPSE